ncbi:MAG: helix-turn-helix transcriptional regulator [Candidatus Omnitrophota bacterium]|nr:helix-turn-helix transcriptional regulator [Candidatus Omnitrophota bacterium]
MAKNVLQQIGTRIRTYRKLARLTQEQLAERADLSPHFLGFVERGQANPSLDSLVRIASALGVQLDELFRFPKEEAQEVRERLQEIHRLLKYRTPQEVRMVKHIIELLPPAQRP